MMSGGQDLGVDLEKEKFINAQKWLHLKWNNLRSKISLLCMNV